MIVCWWDWLRGMSFFDGGERYLCLSDVEVFGLRRLCENASKRLKDMDEHNFAIVVFWGSRYTS